MLPEIAIQIPANSDGTLIFIFYSQLNKSQLDISSPEGAELEDELTTKGNELSLDDEYARLVFDEL